LGYDWKLFCFDEDEELKLFHKEKGMVERIQFPVGETENHKSMHFSPPIRFQEAFDCVVQVYNTPRLNVLPRC
jgi:hypothetical protein